MKCKLLAILSVFLGLCLHSGRAQSCHFRGAANSAATERVLRSTHTCSAAHAYLEKCAWGSSADVNFAAIVISKCENDFTSKLSADQKATYKDKSRLCADEYANQGGTLAISEEWTCLAEVAFQFATNLPEASKPLPRASFDCQKAQSPLERTICTDPELGREDLLLSQSYFGFYKALKTPDRRTLLQNQRAWRKSTLLTCKLSTAPASPEVISCLVQKYRARVSTLDGCSTGLDLVCVASTDGDTQP